MNICIITITFNSHKTIKDSLESIKNQTYKKVDHLIIDGFSSDETLKIVKNYQHVKKIISEPDKGIYDALNKGINNSLKCDMIGFLHSDDEFYCENTLEKNILKYIKEKKKNSQLVGFYGDVIFKDEKELITRKWTAGKFKKWKINFGWMPPHTTLFLEKSIYENMGEFNTKFKISGDYEFILRLLKKPNIELFYTGEIITIMKEGGTSTNGLKSQLLKLKEDYKALRINNYNLPLFVTILKKIKKINQFIKILFR